MKKLIFLAFLCLFSLSVFSQIPDPKPNTYINDFAEVLTPGQIQSVNSRLRALEDRTSVQFAIVLIQKLPDNLDIEQFSNQLGRKWHVGNARNGIVYVMAIDDHKQRLEIADHMQGTITDLEAAEIIDGARSFYKDKDYFGGVDQIVNITMQKITPATDEQKALGDTELKKQDGQSYFWVWVVFGAVPVGIFAWVFVAAYRRDKKRKKQIDKSVGYGNSPSGSNRIRTRYDEDYNGSFSSGYVSGSLSSPSSGGWGSSSSDNSSSSSSSSYGDWGSGSSDSSSSSDSGFSGGGASDSW
jgi:uncharacterized protein